MKLTIKNWSDFQHYKDRSPPWVKLHKTLLDDFDFQCLPIASKALAPMLWLLASENMKGEIDACTKRLAFRLRWDEKDVAIGLKALIHAGFVIDASNVLADCYQDAIPETETETYKPETDKKLSRTKKIASSEDAAAKERRIRVWNSYSTAYANRYGVPPVRNAKTSANVAQLVMRIGADDAEAMAGWFISHQDNFYAKNMHDFGLLLKDCEKLRTQWATGRTVSHGVNGYQSERQTRDSAFLSAIGLSTKPREEKLITGESL